MIVIWGNKFCHFSTIPEEPARNLHNCCPKAIYINIEHKHIVWRKIGNSIFGTFGNEEEEEGERTQTTIKSNELNV